jgi:hypothetical protein
MTRPRPALTRALAAIALLATCIALATTLR